MRDRLVRRAAIIRTAALLGPRSEFMERDRLGFPTGKLIGDPDDLTIEEEIAVGKLMATVLRIFADICDYDSKFWGQKEEVRK